MRRILLIIAVFLPSLSIAGHLHNEKVYQDVWCAKVGGVTEFVLEDKTRVDCLTDQYAVEVDFAPKWAEGIGQALFYGLKTGMRPGVLLIMENDDDDRYMERLKLTAEKYGITTWMITPEEL